MIAPRAHHLAQEGVAAAGASHGKGRPDLPRRAKKKKTHHWEEEGVTREGEDHDGKRDARSAGVPGDERAAGDLRLRHDGVEKHDGAEGGDEGAGAGAEGCEALLVLEQAAEGQQDACGGRRWCEGGDRDERRQQIMALWGALVVEKITELLRRELMRTFAPTTSRVMYCTLLGSAPGGMSVPACRADTSRCIAVSARSGAQGANSWARWAGIRCVDETRKRTGCGRCDVGQDSEVRDEVSQLKRHHAEHAENAAGAAGGERHKLHRMGGKRATVR